jgi:hypothetical protein
LQALTQLVRFWHQSLDLLDQNLVWHMLRCRTPDNAPTTRLLRLPKVLQAFALLRIGNLLAETYRLGGSQDGILAWNGEDAAQFWTGITLRGRGGDPDREVGTNPKILIFKMQRQQPGTGFAQIYQGLTADTANNADQSHVEGTDFRLFRTCDSVDTRLPQTR